MATISQSNQVISASADTEIRRTPASRYWFTTEIQHMMYGFGDCAHPLPQSAMLIENIVYGQMLQVLRKVEDISIQRGARFISIEDFLFLLRNDKTKLKRLLRYLEFRDLKASVVKGAVLDDDDCAELDQKQSLRKRRKICYEFLSAIDGPMGDLVLLMDDNTEDDVKLERKIRADLFTTHMDGKQYAEYCEARQASFAPRFKMQKFRDWLLNDLNLETKLSQFALEILSYLAYETVAEIVDLALVVRRDQRAIAGDPFSQEMAPVSYNYDAVVTGLTSSRPSYGLLTMSAGLSTSPLTVQPTVPAGSSSSASVIPQIKKITKLSHQASLDIATNQAIEPSDIHEALRRFAQPTGPFADFSKSPLLFAANQLLSC